MNTTKSCFASEKDLMLWQECNCLQCKKAVWYNQRLEKMPKYRCAIQKQIEAQAVEKTGINERTYNITRSKKCSMFKSKESLVEKSVVLNFSKGKSVISEKRNDDKQTPAKIVNTGLKATGKQCSSKKTTIDTDNHDVALMKLSMETGMDYKALKDAERKVIKAIESGNVINPLIKEAEFKKQIKSDVGKMLKTFTWSENMMIAFVPLVISHLAWMYAEKVLHYCAEHRISETLKLGRAVKHVREEYLNVLKKDLDVRHLDRINEQTERFHDVYKNDFIILDLSVDAAYMKQYPKAKYREMRVDAYIAILLCRFLVKHNRRMDKVIEAKIGATQSIQDPNMKKLETCMDAYCGDYVIKDTANIEACMRILQNNINAIEFEVDGELPK